MNIKNFADIKSTFFDNRSIKQTIFKNTFWLSIAEGISRLLKFFLIIYIARILGATEYGKFTFALNLVSFLIIFSDLGISSIATREFAKDIGKEKKYLPSFLSLKSFLSLITLLIIGLVAVFITPDPGVKKVIWILAIYSLTEYFTQFFYALLRARQKMEYEAIAKVLNSVFCVVFGFLFLFKVPSLSSLSCAYLIGAIVAALFVFILYKKKFNHLGFIVDRSIWKEILSLSWPLALMAIFASVYHYMDSIMLGAWGYLEENGWYNAAYKIIDIAALPMVLISASFFPLLASTFKKEISKDKREKIFLSQLSVQAILGIPIFLGGILLAPQIINFIYGSQYQNAILAFQILVGTLLIIYLNNTFNSALFSANYQGILFLITFVGVILNILLNLMLIPKYSLYGAAIATLITYLFHWFFCIYFTKKLIGLTLFKVQFLKILGISLFFSSLMAFAILQLISLHLNIFLIILVGVITYLLPILILDKKFKII